MFRHSRRAPPTILQIRHAVPPTSCGYEGFCLVQSVSGLVSSVAVALVILVRRLTLVDDGMKLVYVIPPRLDVMCASKMRLYRRLGVCYMSGLSVLEEALMTLRSFHGHERSASCSAICRTSLPGSSPTNLRVARLPSTLLASRDLLSTPTHNL
jgi:hypothetical protein